MNYTKHEDDKHILEHHRANLRESGLTNETLEKADNLERSSVNNEAETPAPGDTFQNNRDLSTYQRDPSNNESVTAPSDEDIERLVRIQSSNPTQLEKILRINSSEGWPTAQQAAAKEAELAPLDTLAERKKRHRNLVFDFALIVKLWPTIEDCADRGLDLVRLSLTVPKDLLNARSPAQQFVDLVAQQEHQGAFLAIDVRDDGSEHLYGLGIVADGGRAVEQWCELVNADPQACKQQPVGPKDRWQQFVENRNLSPWLREIVGVITYEFKAWPTQFGIRNLSTDVFASGPFKTPWKLLFDPEAPEVALDPKANRKASLSAKKASTICLWCNRLIPQDRRGHAKYCSKGCKQGAYKGRKRAQRAIGGLPHPQPLSTAATVAFYQGFQRRPFSAEQTAAFLRSIDIPLATAELLQLFRELETEDGVIRPVADNRYRFIFGKSDN